MCSLVITCSRLIRHTSVTSSGRSSNLFNTFSKISAGDSLHKDTFQKLKISSDRNNRSQVNQYRYESFRGPYAGGTKLGYKASTEDTETVQFSQRKGRKPMSAAMKFYLEKKRSHDAFIAKERSEFELGKKHLANMMGMDYEVMTQEDVDKAIAYLFPSGLYHPDARPKMRPPEEVL